MRIGPPTARRGVKFGPARNSAGTISIGIYEPVRLAIQGCDCAIEVTEHGPTREEHAPANRSAVVRETLS